jgi:hypothetical protein
MAPKLSTWGADEVGHPGDSGSQSVTQRFGAAAREFAARLRGLADRFAAEPATDMGDKLRTGILTHLSEDAGPAPRSIQRECRQTLCRIQLSGSEPGKSQTMDEITKLVGFRQVIGMERPAGDGAMISDVYMLIN